MFEKCASCGSERIQRMLKDNKEVFTCLDCGESKWQLGLPDKLHVECPECGYGDYELCNTYGRDMLHLPLGVDPDDVICECPNCDWYTVIKRPFSVGGWGIEIVQALPLIDILESLLADQEVVKFLKPRIKGFSYLAHPLRTTPSDEFLRGEIDIAYQAYLKQLIVLVYTYIELIMKDFFTSWFTVSPKGMNQVLHSNSKRNKAYVSLNEVLDESKDELVKSLIEKAANKKGSGEPDKVLTGLIKDCKLELEMPTFLDELEKLKELRNRIVHIGVDEKIAVDQVYANFNLVKYLLYVLARIARHKKIPYIDNVGFIRDIEERLSQ